MSIKISPNELMIGNYIRQSYGGKHIYRVKQISPRGISCFEGIYIMNGNFESISISENFVEALGFTKKEEDTWVKQEIELTKKSQGWNLKISGNTKLEKDIVYLHELQNCLNLSNIKLEILDKIDIIRNIV